MTPLRRDPSSGASRHLPPGEGKEEIMKKIFKFLRGVLNDLCFLGGGALVSWGAWEIYRPAGIIAAGAVLVAFALLIDDGGS